MKRFWILLTLSSLLSCEVGNENESLNEFYVTVSGYDMDCKVTLIDFNKDDSTRISTLTGSTWLTYRALDLNSTFSQVGSTLKVTVSPSEDDEIQACTTFGPTYQYPWITIQNIEILN